MHWARIKRNGDPGSATAKRRPATPCNVDDCDDRAKSWSSGQPLCGKHHARWKRHGDPLAAPKLDVVPTGLKLITEAVASWDRSVCWTSWDGAFNAKGYPKLGDFMVMHLSMDADGRPRPDAPDNHGLHTCDTAACWNPHHLRWGTQEENAADRGERGTGCAHCPHCRAAGRF